MLTFSVIRQEINFLLSPMRTALLINGACFLMWSSIGTGAMFSPPAVMINSIRNNIKYAKFKLAKL